MRENTMNGYFLVCAWLLPLSVLTLGDSADFTTATTEVVRPRVTIPGVGRVNGVRTQFPDGSVEAFLAVPYAKPPLGDLRFRPPVPLDGEWTGVLNATRLPDACSQKKTEPEHEMWNLNANFSENCLYLNIWRPGTAKPPGVLRAVLVWIYGGAFYMGSSARLANDGSMMALKGDVLIVSMNYRLGPFGFLTTDDSSAPGNVGLLDQQLALRWVHDHIAAFGGDPGRVTLFGESAGGTSVGFHLLSPGSEELFNSAIMESGVATTGLTYSGDALTINENTFRLAKTLGCSTSSASDALRCLRQLSENDIVEAHWRMMVVGNRIRSPFRPTVDGKFLPQLPRDLLQSGRFPSKNILLGVNLNEGAQSLVYWFPRQFNWSLTGEEVESGISQNDFLSMVKELGILGVDPSDAAVEAVAFEYQNPCRFEDRGSVTYFNALDDMLSEATLKCPTREVAHVYANTNAANNKSVYLYTFNHRSSENPLPIWSGKAPHMYEMDSVFGRPWYPAHQAKYTDSERKLSERIIRYWTNFAKTGNPNIRDDGLETMDNWPQFTPSQRLVLVMDTTERLRTQTGLIDRQCDYWATVVPKLQQLAPATGDGIRCVGSLWFLLLLPLTSSALLLVAF